MTFTTRLTVAADGTISAATPLPAGEYTADLRAARTGTDTSGRALQIEDWPKLDAVPSDPASTFSRQEIYGDDMR